MSLSKTLELEHGPSQLEAESASWGVHLTVTDYDNGPASICLGIEQVIQLRDFLTAAYSTSRGMPVYRCEHCDQGLDANLLRVPNIGLLCAIQCPHCLRMTQV